MVDRMKTNLLGTKRTNNVKQTIPNVVLIGRLVEPLYEGRPMNECIATKRVYVFEVLLDQHSNPLPAWQLFLEEPEHRLAFGPSCAKSIDRRHTILVSQGPHLHRRRLMKMSP